MNSFVFYNNTRILFGEGQIKCLREQIPKGSRILIVYGGGSIKRNGVLEEVVTALEGFSWQAFGGIEPNPLYETCLDVVELVHREKIDFLLAVGGGSVVDATKFIAAAALHEGDPWQIVTSFGSIVVDALPLGCVLTLAATGSEMNPTSVISRAESKDKLFFNSDHVRPRFSILDPRTTFSLPARQVANGVVDSMVHVLEQYITYPVDAKVQDRIAEGLLATIVEEGPHALEEPANYAVRANLMWAATLALNGLLSTGVPADWASHLIGQELTALYGLDHAQTLAIMVPAIWTYKFTGKQDKLAQYGKRVWNIREGDSETIARQAIEKNREFFEKMGVPTRLSAYGLGEEIIEDVVAKLKEHQFVQLGEHGDITPDDVRSILKLAI